MVTFSQVDWSHGVGYYILDDDYYLVYEEGEVIIGYDEPDGQAVAFDGPDNIFDYLPTGGTPAALACQRRRPNHPSAGLFGGAALALQLDVDFSDAGELNGSTGINFGNLSVCNLSASSPPLNGSTPLPGLNGMTVREVLALANNVLGGTQSPSTRPPSSRRSSTP